MADHDAALTKPAGGLGSRALRNTILVLGARVVSRLIALVTVLATADHLKPANFGDYQAVVAVTVIVAPVAVDFGFNILYQREGARHPDQIERYLQNLVSARLLLSLLALPILAVVLYPLGLVGYVIPAYALMILTSYSILLRATLYAMQRLGYEAVGIVLESVLLLGLTLFGIFTRQGVAYFLWAYTATYAFDCVFFGVLLRAKFLLRYRWRLEIDFLRKWFWMGLPFTVIFILTTLSWKIDVPILKLFRGNTEVGWYSLAYKPFEAMLFVPVTMLGVVLPVLGVYHHQSIERLRTAVVAFAKALVLVGWPATVGLFVLAGPLGALWSGFYPQSVPALRILALAFVFAFANNAFIGALTALDRQASYAWVGLVSLVVNVALNLVFIPLYGYFAASWTTVATEMAMTATGWWLTTRYLGHLPIASSIWRPLLAGLIMGAVLLPLRDVHGPVVIGVVALGAAIYVVAALVLRSVTPDEMEFVRLALRRRS